MNDARADRDVDRLNLQLVANGDCWAKPDGRHLEPERREVEVYAKYKGCDIPDAFIVGYGLDFDEKYRNLPFVGVLKPEVYGEV